MQIQYTDKILGKIIAHGIGKFEVTSKNDWNIPHLHYLIYFSEEDQDYTAYCMELNTHYTDTNYEKAVSEMIRGSISFLNTIVKSKDDMDKLIESVGDTENEYLWAMYRQCEFTLAKEQRDISSQFLARAIVNAVWEAVKEFVEKNSNSDCVILDNVTYTPIQAVA